LRFVVFLLRNSGPIVLLAMLAGGVSGVGNTALLALFNRALKNGDAQVAVRAFAFVALCILVLASRVLSQLILIRIGQRTIFDLRMKLCGQILAAPLRRLEEVGSYRLLATLTEDVMAVTNAMLFVPVLCTNLAIVAACLIYLASLSRLVLCAVVAFMIAAVVTYQLPSLKALHYFKLAREEGDAIFKHFRSMIDGAKELKLNYNRRDFFFSQMLRSTAMSFRRLNTTGLVIFSFASSWGQLLVFILLGTIFFVLPEIRHISSETLTGSTLIILYLMGPVESILGIFPTLGRANVSLKKTESLGLSLKARATEHVFGSRPDIPLSWSRLEMIGMTHRYHREDEDGDFALGPVDLVLHPGELVFMIGGNGSGKTTFAKLLSGLYIPDDGEIRLNNVVVNDENREYYRQHFSAVFSDIYLFDRLFGLAVPQLDVQVREYLGQFQLQHKVQVKNGKLSTTDLSHGQRKRLALLAACLEDRLIYIFDEWAADQDPLFKEIFYYQLLPGLKARGKTALVISHDDRYYHVADRIIKLDYGKTVYDKNILCPQ
jgi:putative ATP-binding cassette transporter